MNRNERAEKFREILAKKKTTCHDLAIKIDVSKQSLYFIMRAKVTPSVETILKIEKELKLEKGTML